MRDQDILSINECYLLEYKSIFKLLTETACSAFDISGAFFEQFCDHRGNINTCRGMRPARQQFSLTLRGRIYRSVGGVINRRNIVVRGRGDISV